MDILNKDEVYMKKALGYAKKAYNLDETPIGCVIVYNDKIIATGYNRRNTDKSTLAHAEISAIKKAAKVLNDWRLSGCTMYVTLEPCQMCAGAIVQARIDRVVIGSMNKKAGCVGSVINLLQMQEFNHQAEVTRGVLEKECSDIMSDFFKKLRDKKRIEDRVKKTLCTMTISNLDMIKDCVVISGVINEIARNDRENIVYLFAKGKARKCKRGDIVNIKVIGVARGNDRIVYIAVKSDRMIDDVSLLDECERDTLCTILREYCLVNVDNMEVAKNLMWKN